MRRDINSKTSFGGASRASSIGCAGVAAVALLGCSAPASALETKAYVVSYFAQQFNSQDGDCPGGVNPDDTAGQYTVILKKLGYSTEEVAQLMEEWAAGGEGEERVDRLVSNRAVIDGERVNAYTHPEATADPELTFVDSKYAYGFNLDGRGAESSTDFVDPQTQEQGVDHQLFRALGCNQNFRGGWNSPSAYGEWVWVQLKDSQPAWLITITGEDLSKDGDVTINIDRALEHLESNLDGTPRYYMTYRIDPDPRSHNEFQGRIEDGVVSITQHSSMSILWNALSSPVLNLNNTHLRLSMAEDGTLDGLLGGFQPWLELYFAFSHNGIVGDRPGLYYALKKAADADPDPDTDLNMSISTAYRISAVPAFTVPAGDSRYDSASVR